MKKILVFTFITMCIHTLIAQKTVYFETLISVADSLEETKQYLAAARSYNKAFRHPYALPYNWDFQSAARCWARVGNKDSACYYLETLYNHPKSSYFTYLDDDAFAAFCEDAHFQDIQAKMDAKEENYLAKLNHSLMAELDSIVKDDQRYRNAKFYDSIQINFGNDSKEMKELWRKQKPLDSLNLIKIEKILAQYGWPSIDEVTEMQGAIPWLIIQHQSDVVIQEKYLPMIKEAVKNKKAHPLDYMMLDDRIRLKNGQKQLYGSQMDCSQKICDVGPLEDPINVDKRRFELGVWPLEFDVRKWNPNWTLEAYLERQKAK